MGNRWRSLILAILREGLLYRHWPKGAGERGCKTMQCNEAQMMKTHMVRAGATVVGDLSTPGALRFERVGAAMRGTPELAMQNGALTLRYADGTTVIVTA